MDDKEQSTQELPSLTEDNVEVTISYVGKSHSFSLAANATLQDLSQEVTVTLSIPPENQKFIIRPNPGLVKPPFTSNSDLLISELSKRKITLLGSTAAEKASLNDAISSAQAAVQRRSNRNHGPVKAATPSRTRDWKKIQDESTYTFLQLRPLPYLPSPDRSLRFLERLRDDPGIKASMIKHKWSVPLLTEMNPSEHTTHESRTLGLNRNGGEVIELRLRTDAHDGYRDYKTIRKTLCHEMAHNIFSEHDRNFWDLCHKIEREVEKADWKHGGRTVGNEEFYNPNMESEDVHADHGAWQGGEYTLGGGNGNPLPSDTMSRRDILARAAEERMKKPREQQDGS